MAEDHWASFPHKQSHYGRKKNERKFFDNPDLKVKILYSLFKEYYKQKTGTDLSMKYNTYHKFFRKNSDYSFRSPKTDVCDFCTKCSVKLSADPDDNCRADHKDHSKKVKEYKELKQKYVFEQSADNIDEQKKIYEETLILEFDYAQNLTLPRLNINSHYYKRILNLYVFNIYCFNDKDSKMFCFLESDGRKDSNSVCSFLEDFIKKKLSENPNFKKIVICLTQQEGRTKI